MNLFVSKVRGSSRGVGVLPTCLNSLLNVACIGIYPMTQLVMTMKIIKNLGEKVHTQNFTPARGVLLVVNKNRNMLTGIIRCLLTTIFLTVTTNFLVAFGSFYLAIFFYYFFSFF